MVGTAVVREHFERSFGLYRDLAAGLDRNALESRLADVASNTIGGQLWCVVGARESYAAAITAGAWDGFSCSLDEPGDPAKVADALARSAAEVSRVLDAVLAPDGQGDLGGAREALVLDLLEHEAQHHGQLIRYLYGLQLPIPASWRTRYALS